MTEQVDATGVLIAGDQARNAEIERPGHNGEKGRQTMNTPAGWSRITLGGNVEIYSGVAPAEARPCAEGTVPYVKVEDLNNSVKYQISSRQFTAGGKGVVPAGSVLFPKRGGAIMTNKVRLSRVELVMDTNLMALHPSSRIDAEFLFYALSHAGLSKVADASTIPQINNKHIMPFRLSLPPLPEQRKIADILRTWDDAIERSELLMIRLRGQHRLLLQGLIARHAHGSHMALRDLVEPVKTKNTVGERNVLTSSARDGLVSQTEYFNKNVAGKNLAGYYLLHRDDFAYNRSSSAGHPFGAIRRLDRYDRGVISTLYLCFRLRKNSPMSGTFLQNIFNSEVLNRQLSPICREGARSHGLLNIAQADFFELVVPVPTKEAQVIANKALAESSLEIELLQRKVKLLRIQKRGLMQKLLTGQLRVNVAAEIDPRGAR